MRNLSMLMHLAIIIALCVFFIDEGAPEESSDWVWRGLFLLLPAINLFILFKFKKVKKPE